MAQSPASTGPGPRTRWLRTAGIVAAVLVGVAVLLYGALTAALRSQRVAELIRDQITSATGRDANFDGGLQLDADRPAGGVRGRVAAVAGSAHRRRVGRGPGRRAAHRRVAGGK